MSDRKRTDQQLVNYKASLTMKARVSLGLSRLSVPAKIEKGHHVVESMSSEPIFKNCIPPLAEVSALLAALETAYRSSLDGGTEAVALAREKEQALDNALSRLANFVEIAANGSETVILSAGMDVRQKPIRSQVQFDAMHGKKEGEALLRVPALGRAAYIWQKRALQAATDESVSNWEQVGVTTTAKVTVQGLVSGTKYQFRVAYVTSEGQGAWSDPVSLVAQ